MRTSRVKAKLRANQPALVTTLHLTDPSVYEMVSLMGFDCIWIDLEHHSHSVQTAGQLMRAARSGSSDILARPAKGEFMRMGRLLEAGAQGILYPRCDDADEAAEVVRWSKFAPQGQRGIDGANPDMPYLSMPLPQYLKKANAETFVAIQIESEEALAQADQIAAVDGVDIVFLGPGDFSILGGYPGQWDHPRLAEAFRQLADSTARAGKHWGCPVFTVEHAREMIHLGARFVCHQADITLLKAGFERIQADFSQLGFSFPNSLAAPS